MLAVLGILLGLAYWAWAWTIDQILIVAGLHKQFIYFMRNRESIKILFDKAKGEPTK